MDTPEPDRKQNQSHNQITTPVSKFEDSPVFNYINNLSPIEPIKSVHVSQTFSSLNFTSPPSIFTSPHVTSYRESRFRRRQQSPDPSKPEYDSKNGNKTCTDKGDSTKLCDNSDEIPDNFDPVVFIGTPSGNSKFSVELPQTLKYDSGSPDDKPTSRCGFEAHYASELAGTSTSVETSEEGSEGKLGSQLSQREHNKEPVGCEWEILTSDASDLLIFKSPGDSEMLKGLMQKSLDSGTRFCPSFMSHQDNINDAQKAQLVDQADHGDKDENADHLVPAGATEELEGLDHSHKNLNDKMESDNEPVSYLHRGIRRRCLDFEMVGVSKSLDNEEGASSYTQSSERISSNDKQLVPPNPGNNTSRCMLPGIGLHLNALATASKDCKNTKHAAFNLGQHQLKLLNSTSSSSVTIVQEPLQCSLPLASSERDVDVTESGVQVAEDASQTSSCLAIVEYNPNSLKKKRRNMENASETEACKRCNCKKSKCLKLYCECFAAGVYCIEPCSCQDCFNKPIHEDTVLATRKQIESRNPLAFAPKVIRTSDFACGTGDEPNKTPASARHKRGCNCKKSNCLKKYCECYQGGVGCSISCRCEGCKNAFGRKDGTGAEPDDETEISDKNVLHKSSHDIEADDSEGKKQNPASAVPETPLQLCRPMVQLPFSSTSQRPRSSSFLIGSSSGLYTGQKFRKPNFLQPQSKFENQLQTVPEDEMPDILQENCSPSSFIKSASPNSKRVSPPNRDAGSSSPARRSGRKLILQSIPSFPSLTPHH